jgi:hypothetical protein
LKEKEEHIEKLKEDLKEARKAQEDLIGETQLNEELWAKDLETLRSYLWELRNNESKENPQTESHQVKGEGFRESYQEGCDNETVASKSRSGCTLHIQRQTDEMPRDKNQNRRWG